MEKMSKVKSKVDEGAFMDLCLPVKYDIRLKKVSDEMWEVEYTEWFSGDRATLKKIMSDTMSTGIPTLACQQLGGRLKIRDNRVSFTATLPFETVASMMLGEFIVASKIGNIRLKELLLFAAMGTSMSTAKEAKEHPK